MGIKISAFIAASLDGFIAREDGGIDWLEENSLPDEDFGYADFFASIDALVMGRRTFETVLGFGEWPYTGKKVIVLSRTMTIGNFPGESAWGVEIYSGSLTDLLTMLEGAGYQHVYTDGGQAICSFIREGLLDELILTRIPVLLGRGVPLFGDLLGDVRLNHVSTKAYPNGYVQSRYTLKV